MAGYRPGVQRAHHQEVSVSRKEGKTNIQVAAIFDRISIRRDRRRRCFGPRAAKCYLMFIRVLLRIRAGTSKRAASRCPAAKASFGYDGDTGLFLRRSTGSGASDIELQDARQWMRVERRHSVAAKFSGTVPRSKTRWIASYRWVNGSGLTPVDLFNASAGDQIPI